MPHKDVSVSQGLYNGRHIRNELSQYLFNEALVNKYISSISNGAPILPPEILIELYINSEDEDFATLEGDGNSEKESCSGIYLKVQFDEQYKSEYESLVQEKDVKTIPIEYYQILWKSFARDPITFRSIPLRSAFIDSSNVRYQNGSDVYISRIVKELLSSQEIISVSQSHRKMKESFMAEESIQAINEKITNAGKITEKEVTISVELSSGNAWESGLTTYLDRIPFHFIGKGEQSIVKTNLALAQNRAKEANILLIEEPESHLSHTKLNQLIRTVKENCAGKQIILTTHSSFVANKLGLNDLVLLSGKKAVKLDQLKPETKSFFEKIAGYDTLRLILCRKAILVEGDSDELVVKKAYRVNNENRLPIEDCIDVISVGVSFLRFLEIAEKLNQTVCVVTDNDGDIDALNKKYEEYLGDNAKDNIRILFDTSIDTGELTINGKRFNYNTLEPKILKANSREVLNKVFGLSFTNDDDLLKYMKANKTSCALKIFDTEQNINYPQYILDSIK